jgi:predicted dehydrogenase
MPKKTAPQVTVIGGGMITGMQILPSLYHMQRMGVIGEIAVCALNAAPLRALAEDPALREAFPGRSFTPYPDFRKVAPEEKFPSLYEEVVRRMPKRNIVFVAAPDQMHYPVILKALAADQHVVTVKPLVLKYREAVEIEDLARRKGLFVGVEYHKRFDDRALIARLQYRKGDLGEFKLGQAALNEPWYYRDSNFQNWCTCENSDMFTYVGCHYVDQVHFITGLLPVEVSVHGIKEAYPNGNLGFLWCDARVVWENGAALSVMDGMCYPNAAPGGNWQGLRLFCKGSTDGCLVMHDDQYRGVKHCYDTPSDGKTYHEVSPDYFKLVYRGGKGLEPVGYGYRSIEALIRVARRVESGRDVRARRAAMQEIDDEGVLATPGNSSYNELVVEAGRMSILNGGRPVTIRYGKKPGVRFKTYEGI